MVIRRNDYVAFERGGAVAGYTAGLYVNPEANIGVFVLANAGGAAAVNPDDLALKSLDTLSE